MGVRLALFGFVWVRFGFVFGAAEGGIFTTVRFISGIFEIGFVLHEKVQR
jgi:hypothetical protein